MPTGLQGFTAMIAGVESAVKWSGTFAGSAARRRWVTDTPMPT
jgi:hypothetical protein